VPELCRPPNAQSEVSRARNSKFICTIAAMLGIELPMMSIKLSNSFRK